MVVPPAMFARPMPGSRGRQEQSPEPTFVSVSAADARPPTTERATPHGVHVEVQAVDPAVQSSTACPECPAVACGLHELSGYSAVGVPVTAPHEERHCHLVEGIGVCQQQPRQLADGHVPGSARASSCAWNASRIIWHLASGHRNPAASVITNLRGSAVRRAVLVCETERCAGPG